MVDEERFRLADQAAQDLGRYDVLKDLLRIESLVRSGEADRGYVVTLTNDSSYWKGPTPLSSPNYAAFRLMEGRELGGILAWGPATGAGTMKGREAAISLAGTYRCDWEDYSDLDAIASYKQFRFLLLEDSGRASALPPEPLT